MPGRRIDRTPPPVGSVYDRVFKGTQVRMSVVATADGIVFRVGDRDYRTPTAAAKSVTGNEVNGWSFWRMD